MRLVTLLIAVVAARPAFADVDWARGVVTADGLGIADRHAPSPATARGTSRRVAEDAGRRALASKLGELPLAGGGTVASRARDPEIKARLDAAVAHAYAIAAEPETDGAWRVTMAVPIEAVRQALDGGARALPAAGDRGAPVIVIDGATAAKPAIGYAVGGVRGATIFVAAAPAWASAAPHVAAVKVAAAAIDAPVPDATPATLFVIVAK